MIMKSNYINRLTALATMATLLLSLTSCQGLMEKLVRSPDPYIENIIEGHEQIYSVQAILRLAQRYDDPDFEVSFEPYYYDAYELDDQKLYPYPVYQEIEIRKMDDGSMQVTSEREAFDVIKSSRFYYALELKYFDINNKLINHQFSRWYRMKDGQKNSAGGVDDPNSTLLVHQHFFSIDNYALDGRPTVFPMTFNAVDPTLDSLYIDRFTFQREGGNLVPATRTSTANVFVPEDYDGTSLRYNHQMALEAEGRFSTNKILESYSPAGDSKRYKLYKTIDGFDMNAKIVPQIFSYEYRDTDPVEEYLGTEMEDQDDISRIRTGNIVGLLRFRRYINEQAELYQYDHLGFKGVLQFKEPHIQFQMSIRIAHILNDNETNKTNLRFPFGKYKASDKGAGLMGLVPNQYNQIEREWSSYDISFPLPFRVIADLDGDPEAFVKDVKAVYTDADESELRKMFVESPQSYFNRRNKVIF